MPRFILLLLVFLPLAASFAKQDSVAISKFNYHGDTLYNYVEEMPKPSVDLNRYLSTSMRYPDDAREGGIQGKVYLGFVIDREGYVGAVVVVRSSGNASLDEEAVRVIWQMPQHIPGKHKGVPVHVYREFPIAFKLD